MKVSVVPPEFVRSGQVIIDLEPTGTDTSTAYHDNRLEEVERRIRQNRALVSLTETPDYQGPASPDLPSSEQWVIMTQYSALSDRVASTQRSSRSAADQLAIAQEVLADVRLQTDKRRSLIESGIFPRNAVYELNGKVADARVAVVGARLQLEQSNALHEQARAQRSSFLAQQRVQYEEEHRKLIDTRAQIQRERQVAQQHLAKSRVTAPIPGYLEAAAPVFEGRPVAAGDVLFRITPTSANYKVQAFVPNQSVGNVAVGDKVRVQLDAFPHRRYGTLDGVVLHVPAEAQVLADDFQQLPSAMRPKPEYTVEVELKRVPPAIALQLRTGLTGRVDIISGRRTIGLYLLGPIFDRIGPVFGES